MEDRRTFFKKALSIIGVGFVALKSGVAFAKKLAIKVDKVPTLAKVGGSATVKLGGQDILLIRRSQTEVRGVSPKCPHQSCDVTYNPKTSNFDCPCHGSAFDLNGKVLKGPATTGLKSFPATLEDGRIVITVE